MKNLSGLNAVVTGASRGIGTYIAEALADQGMNVALAARSLPELESVAARLRERGVQTLAVPTDVTQPLDREALVQRAESELGSIDVLVNNAGVEGAKPYEERAPDEIERIIQVNLIAPMLLTRLVIPGMLQRGRGHIVNVSSMAGRAGVPYWAPYSSSKGGPSDLRSLCAPSMPAGELAPPQSVRDLSKQEYSRGRLSLG